MLINTLMEMMADLNPKEDLRIISAQTVTTRIAHWCACGNYIPAGTFATRFFSKFQSNREVFAGHACGECKLEHDGVRYNR